MFTIINKSTNKPMKINYTNDSHGQCYMTYDRPTFCVEDSDKFNTDYPIFVTPSKEVAEEVLSGKFNGEDSITKPAIQKGWDSNGDMAVYEVVEVKV